MSDQTNFKVYCFLRIIECISSLICFSLHIFTIMTMKDEFYRYEIFIRFSYLAFAIFSAISAIGHIKYFLNFYFEAASAIFGFIFFIFVSIWSMYVVENDEHLKYLTETEEYQHFFFHVNRFQSVFTLTIGMLFLMHAVFSFDIILGVNEIESSASLRQSSSLRESQSARKSLKLHFFPEEILKKRKIFKKYFKFR